MLYRDMELYNVHELLDGAMEDLLPAETRAEFERMQIANLLPHGRAGEGQWVTRIPDALRRSLNPLAQMTALDAPGCELRFNLLSDEAAITLRSAGAGGMVEIYQGSFARGSQPISDQPTPIHVPRLAPSLLDELSAVSARYGLPYDAGLTRVVLPWSPATRLVEVTGETEPPRAGQTPPHRCLCYGSSITHGGSAMRPTGTYAMRLAQHLGMDLINLGFGGGAHLEPQMADYIAGRNDWELATLEMGINIIGSIETDEFARRVDYFVSTIAGAHARQWIFCIDLFTCAIDFRADPKIAAFRQIVRDQVARLDLPRLVYVPGNELLTSPAGLTIDLVHPSPAGMEQIAANLAARIQGRLAL